MKKTAAISLATVLVLSLGVGCAKSIEHNNAKNDSITETKTEKVEINQDVLSKYYDLIDAYIEMSNRYEAEKQSAAQEQASPDAP